MQFLILIFLVILLPGIHSDLTRKEKEMTLHEEYKNEYWNDILLEILYGRLTQGPKDDIPVNVIRTEKLLISALHERFMAIRLHMACLQCAWHYKATPISNNDKYANECSYIASVVAWYNGKLSAKKFVEQYREFLEDEDESDFEEEDRVESECGPGSIGGQISKIEKIPFEDFAKLIDIVLERLKNLNAIFEEAKTAESYKDYLSRHIAGFDVPFTANDNNECHEFIGKYLWKYLGDEVQKMFDYMWSFLEGEVVLTKNENRSPIWKVAEKQYEYIRKAIRIEDCYKDVRSILYYENTLIIAELEVHNIKEGTNFEYREWNIKKNENGQGFSSYIFVFE